MVCLLILTLPFIPAVREWLRPTDASALPVSAQYTSDIDHFARRLHADVSARMGEGPSTGYEDFDVLFSADIGELATARKRVIVDGSVHSAQPLRSTQPVYVRGDLHAAAESRLPALYASGDIHLGAESVVHDWAHANGVLRIGDRGVALRRVSAGKAVMLGEEAWFERLQAPAIYFGKPDESLFGLQNPPADPVPATASYADLPDAVRQTPDLYFIRGNCSLPPGKVFHGSLVVTGFLVIGEGTTVVGDIKAREGASIGPGAWVQGAITCDKRIYVFSGARTLGPVVSETDILIGEGAVIGLARAETTVSARNIIAEAGSVVHGSVWAHEIGMVKSP
ncbi:MAG: polymer-forming cytoskeletal protein [Burkholderiales bacterium]|nr:MAG: polymer-forming cytoskeletal protein [Burkholderiales bacterium]